MIKKIRIKRSALEAALRVAQLRELLAVTRRKKRRYAQAARACERALSPDATEEDVRIVMEKIENEIAIKAKREVIYDQE